MIFMGEIFSFLAAIFLCYSLFSKTKNKMIHIQIFSAMANFISNIFLFSYSGAITNFFAILRNYISYKGKNSLILTISICILLTILGMIFNNQGIIGVLPILATLEYTICMYKVKKVNNMLISAFFNVLLWSIYDFYIMSYPMFVMDVVTALVSIHNYFKNKHQTTI